MKVVDPLPVFDEKTSTLVCRKEDPGWCLEIFISHDRLHAYIRFVPKPSKPPCPPEKVIELVRGSPIILSDEEEARLPNLAASLVKQHQSSTVVLCQGIPAPSAWDGVKWLIPTGAGGKPGAPSETRTSHQDVTQIINVVPGQPLCEIRPVTETGLDAYGLPIVSGEIPVTPGDNVQLIPGDPAHLEATCTGYVCFKEPVLSVNHVFEVNGDVDYKVGNIDFIGPIVIHGNILDGFHLKSGEDIVVEGMVGNCTIDALGDLTIKGGVAGLHQGRITSGKELTVHYLHQVTASASGNIQVMVECHDSLVSSGRSVSVTRGGIIGGSVLAAGNVQAAFIGSEMCVPTKIAAGYDSTIIDKADKLRIPLASAGEQIRGFEKALGPYLDNPKKVETLPKSQLTRILALQAQLDDARQMLQKCRHDLLQLAASNPNHGATISAQKQIFPNVQLSLDAICFHPVKVELNGPVKVLADLGTGEAMVQSRKSTVASTAQTSRKR